MSKSSNKPSLEILSDDALLKGVGLAIENADELINDAIFLKKEKRWSRAYTLCQLAIEECGKAGLLIEVFVYRLFFRNAEHGDIHFDKEIDYHKMNKSFYNHQPKTKKIIELQIELLRALSLNKTIKGMEIIDEWIKELNEEVETVERFDLLKNESLYVSFKESGFSSPNQRISEEMVIEIHDRAFTCKTILAFVLSDMEKNFFLLFHALLKTGNLKKRKI